jgi:hypothetical protein
VGKVDRDDLHTLDDTPQPFSPRPRQAGPGRATVVVVVVATGCLKRTQYRGLRTHVET